jgi:PAS domain S-box-containing protein
MDDVRAQVTAMAAAQVDIRQEISVSVKQQVKRVLLALFVAGIGCSLLIAFFIWRRIRQVGSAYEGLLHESRRQTEKAYESTQWFQTTLESIGDGVIACDAAGHIVLMNQVARNLTGWSLEDARNLPLEDVFHIIDRETHETCENPVAKVRRLNAVVPTANHTLLVQKKGSELVLEDSAAPIRDKRGDISGIVLVFRDVTERRRTKDALVASEKTAMAGRLASSIAHEIHNPLDSVANLHHLLRGQLDPEEREEYLRLADVELARALQISRAMLGLYDTSQGPVTFELKALIENVLVMLDRESQAIV